ncbi:MAG: zinc-ribbon domain containing protein [Christensenellales bacterium]
MEDKKFTCCDCKKEFVWTVENQKFFKDNKIDKEPVRCRECAIILRDKRKQEAKKEKQNKNQAEVKPEKQTEKNKK